MKILMVLTSHDKLGNTGRKTGFWLEEFAAPYFTFKDAGAEIVLASPHIGYVTEELYRTFYGDAAASVAAWLDGQIVADPGDPGCAYSVRRGDKKILLNGKTCADSRRSTTPTTVCRDCPLGAFTFA
jgi:putative intracellular protease/amidase